MTSALTLSASEHADVRLVSYDVIHTRRPDEQRSGLSYDHIKVSGY